jgi:hypothetical protein
MIVVFLVVLLFIALIGVGTYFVLTMNSNDVPTKLAEVYSEYFPQAEKAQTREQWNYLLNNVFKDEKEKIMLEVSEAIKANVSNLKIVRIMYGILLTVNKLSGHEKKDYERILGIAQTVAPTPVPTGATTSAPTPAPAGITTPAPTPVP